MHAIRRAELSDAALLSELAESTFRATFGNANTHENMELHCQSSYGVSIQSDEISEPSRITLLVELGGELIGFAQLRFKNAPNFVPGNSPGEIQRIYVAHEWHGKGIAAELMARCFWELRARGSDSVWLGVWEHNSRALAFYRKVGFTDCGKQVFPVGLDPQTDIVMARMLGEA